MNKQAVQAIVLAFLVLTGFVACGESYSGTDIEKTVTAPVTQVQPVTVGFGGEPTGTAGDIIQDEPASDESSVAPALTDASFDAAAVVIAYEEILGGIYNSVLPSVVQIKVQENVASQRYDGYLDTPEGYAIQAEGSGFVWSDQGHIVTNYHVIEDADKVMVVFADGSEFKADVLGGDPHSDLAVLKINSPDGRAQPVRLGNSNDLKVGQLVVAIGSPYGQEFSMTSGIISALGRTIPSNTGNFSNPQTIQTDTSLNPGNSGGPLLDREGNVIGINSQIMSSSGASSGVGFAVPINTAKRVVPELIAGGEYEYAYLGISGVSLTPSLAEANSLPEDTRGAFVVDVVDHSPADQAGLLGSSETGMLDRVEYPVGGDIISTIDGVPVEGFDDLITYLVENTSPGDEVTLTVLSGSIERSGIVVTLGARPESNIG